MIAFVVITAVAFAETLLILAAAWSWRRNREPDHAATAARARAKSALRAALGVLPVARSRGLSGGQGRGPRRWPGRFWLDCAEGEYDRASVGITHERLAAFRDWLREVIGYQTYRTRGWL